MNLPAYNRKEILIAATLFAITLLTATFAGLQHALTEDLVAGFLDVDGQLSFSGLLSVFASHWTKGLPFSLALIGILLSHELGHFFAGRYHRIEVSLPYFIPAPTLIGTFGAVIRMRGMLPHRTGLLDVGAAGPLVGFVVAVPLYVWGMANSTVISGDEMAQAGLFLGDSLMTYGVQWMVWGTLPAGSDIMLHPVAFAAWIGFFVTCLNLIPIGQLDGGHIVYALTPTWYPVLTRVSFVMLLVFGAVGWSGWFFWAGVTWLLGVSRHPRPFQLEHHLDERRRAIGVGSILVFVLTFVPNPFILV